MEDHLKYPNTNDVDSTAFNDETPHNSASNTAEPLVNPYKMMLHNTDKRKINAVVALMKKEGAGSKRAWVLMFNTMRGRIMGSLKRRGVEDADAQELMGDVIHRFIWSEPHEQSDVSALALLKTIVNGVWIDWVRKNKTQMRGGEIHFFEYDESDGNTDEPKQPFEYKGTSKFTASIEMKDCLSRTFDFFKDEHPELAAPLLLTMEGLSSREIAALQLAIHKKDVTTKQENAAKSRICYAIRQAQAFFKHCKE